MQSLGVRRRRAGLDVLDETMLECNAMYDQKVQLERGRLLDLSWTVLVKNTL